MRISQTKSAGLKVLLLVGALSAVGANAADSQAGAKTYERLCAQCHGNRGEGVMPGAPKFNRGERLLQPDSMLLATILKGKNAMPPFNGVLREREILDVIAHVRTLQR